MTAIIDTLTCPGYVQNNYPVIVHGILAAGGVVSAFNPLHQAQVSYESKMTALSIRCLLIQCR
jgi:hypothetical protein